MGEVFLSRDLRTGRDVALKLIRFGMDQDPYFRAMFLREAEASSLFHHPNVVQTLDVGQEDTVLYLAQEYVHGASLGALLGPAFDTPMSAFILGEVLTALAYVHQLEDESGRPLLLAHRDISPANILLSLQGEVKIADFGIAKLANSTMTRASEVKGNPRYMSPEQSGLLGSTGPIDHRSDLFSAGVVLYRLVRGKPLFNDVASWIAEGAAIPEGPLSAVLARALAVAPEERYSSSEEFLEALRPMVGEPAASRRELAALVAAIAPQHNARSPLEALVLREINSEEAQTRRLGGGLVSDGGAGVSSDVFVPVAPDHPRFWHRSRVWLLAGLVLALLVAAGTSGLFVPGSAGQASLSSPGKIAADAADQLSAADHDAGGRAESAFSVSDAHTAPPKALASKAPDRKQRKRSVQERSRRSQSAANNERQPGFLTLDSDPWANVYLGDQLLGTTPFARVELPAGTHRLQLKFRSIERARFVKITIRPGELTRKRYEAAR